MSIKLPYKPINFLNTGNEPIRDLVFSCAVQGFQYKQVREMVGKQGYFLTVEQYKAACTLVDEQINLDIGHKQHLLGRKIELVVEGFCWDNEGRDE